MKKLVTIICSILLMLSLGSTLCAEEAAVITISNAVGNEESVSIYGSVDKDITAVVIQVVDGNGQVLSMQTVEVVDKAFSIGNIYADLEIGNVYTVKVADFDGGKWFKKDFTCNPTPAPVPYYVPNTGIR